MEAIQNGRHQHRLSSVPDWVTHKTANSEHEGRQVVQSQHRCSRVDKQSRYRRPMIKRHIYSDRKSKLGSVPDREIQKGRMVQEGADRVIEQLKNEVQSLRQRTEELEKNVQSTPVANSVPVHSMLLNSTPVASSSQSVTASSKSSSQDTISTQPLFDDTKTSIDQWPVSESASNSGSFQDVLSELVSVCQRRQIDPSMKYTPAKKPITSEANTLFQELAQAWAKRQQSEEAVNSQPNKRRRQMKAAEKGMDDPDSMEMEQDRSTTTQQERNDERPIVIEMTEINAGQYGEAGFLTSYRLRQEKIQTSLRLPSRC